MGEKFDNNKDFYYENGFYLTSKITRIAKILAHYELYKMIIDLPGQIIECGVFKGVSLIRFATFRDLFESPYSRKIIGFDIFGKFPLSGNKQDNEFAKRHDEITGYGISVEELTRVFEYKQISNFELVKGDINETIPEYVDKHPELKISLLHIDTDVYKPTKTILENLWGKVVRNGIVILDDYATIAGETNAVDEFFKNKGIKINKFSFAMTPCYIIKEE